MSRSRNPFAIAVVAALALAVAPARAAQSPQVILPGAAIPQFVQPLPLLSVAGGTMNTVFGNVPLTITMCEFDSRVLPPPLPPTRTWGYIVGTACPPPGTVQDTYIGPVIVNNRGSPTTITWVNNLGTTASTGVTFYKYSTDQTMHWADPLNGEANMCNHMSMYPPFGTECSKNYGESTAAPIPAVTHLHGGEVPAQIDGGPDAWFTSDGAYQGHGYYDFAGAGGAGKNFSTYAYPNTQEAAPIWFHDHTLGATRLNVYAGLAGAYFIQDSALTLPANLQPLAEVVPVVLQDRMFDTNGQFFYQSDSAGGILWTTNPEHPYWTPEFVGDTIVVNGKAWPYLDVQARRYRFLFLNGSNARTYEMNVVDPVTGAAGPNFWVIGTDGGYLDTAVLTNKLTMQPGERYEVILDFAGFAGTNLVIKNTGRTPYPRGVAPQGATLGRLMQFRVAAGAVVDNTFNPAVNPQIRTGTQVIRRLANPATGTLAAGVTPSKIRQLTLNEVMGMPMAVAADPVTGLPLAYPGGPLEILVNNTKWGGERITGIDPATGMYTKAPIPGFTLDGAGWNYLSELPKEGETELWEIVNLTADTHPIHLHLVQFQLVNRQAFNTNSYPAAYAAAFPGGGFDITTNTPCLAGAFCPAYGPPRAYDPAQNPLSGGKYGGNPDVGAVKKGGQPLYLQGPVKPPLAHEAGWKDTVMVNPGEVTRIVVRYAPTDLPTNTPAASAFFPFDPSGTSGGTAGKYTYVWHCHIIDHEDNEMMRPTAVTPNAAATRTVVAY